MEQPINVAEWIESRPKWTHRHELDVVNATTGVRGTIYVSNALDGTRIVATRIEGQKRQGGCMDQISYQEQEPQIWRVKIGRKTVGKIIQSMKGFRYYSIPGMNGGEFYSTLAECKSSLEAA